MTDVQKKPLGWLQIVGTLLVVAVAGCSVCFAMERTRSLNHWLPGS